MAKNDYWDYNAREEYSDNQPYPSTAESVEAGVGSFMRKVFGWMFFGLLVTAGAAFAFIMGLSASDTLLNLAMSPFFMISLIIAEFVAVFAISFGINKITAGTARLLFILYSAINGVTISYVCLAYAGATVTKAFIMTAIFFGIMALYGYVSKSDLTRFGPILLAGLLTLVIMTLVNMFMKSGAIDYIICLAGLGIFAGLTAYDVQKIKKIYYGAATSVGGGSEGTAYASKLAIIGALALYLDFVNMFLYLLRLLGRKK